MDILKIFVIVVLSIVSAFDICMIIRVICSWIFTLRETKLFEFVYILTEPVIKPVRDWLYRFDSIRTFPLDLSFLVVFIMVNILESLLSALVYYL